ncbi:hypothetical protein BDV3_003792 [Batrachochytrium dendrobatidis]|nr:hypothetical protein O5D80_005573 [Batrachochytrium dendrobatidis]
MWSYTLKIHSCGSTFKNSIVKSSLNSQYSSKYSSSNSIMIQGMSQKLVEQNMRAIKNGSNLSETINDECRQDSSRCPMLWVTYSTYCSLGSNRLADLLGAAGIPLAVLGYGSKWKARWGLRIRILHDYLLTQPEDRLIVWSDSDDVIITPGTTVSELISRYNSLVDLYNGPRVFFAAEIACYPRGDLWSNYTDPEHIQGKKTYTPFRYLNAGIMIGPAGLIRRLIQVVYQHDCYDDQLLFTLALLDPIQWWRDPSTNTYEVGSSTLLFSKNQPPRNGDQNSLLKIDTAQQLIQIDHWNLLSVAMYGISANQYQILETAPYLNFLETNSRPLILHQSGSKKDDHTLEVLAKKFGYVYETDFSR